MKEEEEVFSIVSTGVLSVFAMDEVGEINGPKGGNCMLSEKKRSLS